MVVQTLSAELQYAFFETDIGRCAIAWSDNGIVAVELPDRSDAGTLRRIRRRFAEYSLSDSTPPQAVRTAIERLIALLAGKDSDLSRVKIDFETTGVPPFHRKVYEAVRNIPRGAVVSYGQLADAVGSPGAARAVGQAMARNPFPLVVPCHRVIGSNGAFVGFSAYGGCELKEKLLRLEQTDNARPVASASRRERRHGTAPLGAVEPVGMRFAPGKRARLPFDPDRAVAHLSARDKRLGRLIAEVGDFRLELDEMLSPFEALAESIVYQQLTGKAAATIFSRVKAIWNAPRLPDARTIGETPIATLRGAGLSQAKALALQDLAAKQAEGLIPTVEELEGMDDEQIIQTLTKVRGVGRWTAQMLLIFRLGRPDVLPVNDYGVRKGYARTFGKKDLPTPGELAQHGEKWRPYRSVASWYLWRALEPE